MKPAAAEYDDLHDENSEYLRARSEKGKARTFIIGKVVANVKWQKHTKLNLPDDVKKQYSETDPYGKFVPKIAKVSE